MFKKLKTDTVDMHKKLALTANLLGEPARAAILLKLMSGRALPAGELALAANISPQTASGHLAKLVDGCLIQVERHGRHRYYRLVGTQVADAIESLLALTTETHFLAERNPGSPMVGTLAHARTCYAHLAGWLGVQIADALQTRRLILPSNSKAFVLTESGRFWFQELKIVVPSLDVGATAKLAKQCLDWTERRPHLAGSLGIAMYKRFLTLEWIARLPETRAVRVTLEGKQQLWRHLRIAIA